MLSWWWRVITYPLPEIDAICGPDAYLYLRFQQAWLYFFGFGALASLLIFLPLNLHGGIHTITSFQDTTILHIEVDSPALWCHLFYLLAILLFSLWFIDWWRCQWEPRLRPYNRSSGGDDHRLAPRFQDCTVLLTGIPNMMYSQLDALHHFLHHHYPDLILLHPILDLRSLERLHQEYRLLAYDLDYFESEAGRTSAPITISHPTEATTLCTFHLFGPHVDALAYTRQRLEAVRVQIQRANDLAQDALESGVAFLTFSSSAAALEFIYDIQIRRQDNVFRRWMQPCFALRDKIRGQGPAPAEFDSSERLLAPTATEDPIFEDPQAGPMQLDQWSAALAPAPDDIFWPALGMSPREHLIRTVAVNVALFFIFMFWSTPAALLSSIDYFTELFGVHSISMDRGNSSFLASFFLLLLMILIPLCLHLSSQLEGHNTFADLEHFGMRKVFAFLVLTTLLLPSCVSTSASALLEVLLSRSWQQISLVLGRTFPNSSMFVNFVIQVAFFATAFELLKLESHILFFLKSRRVRNPRHLNELRKEIQRRPTYGFWYASLIALIAVILFYAPLVPYMMPAGFVWLWLRHCTDKHNIMYLHKRQAQFISGQIVKTASSFVVIAVGLSITGMFAFLTLVKHASGPAFVCFLMSIPLMAYYFYLYFIEWPLIDEQAVEDLFENETPLSIHGACDLYLHPVGKTHRKLLRSFPIPQVDDASGNYHDQPIYSAQLEDQPIHEI